MKTSIGGRGGIQECELIMSEFPARVPAEWHLWDNLENRLTSESLIFLTWEMTIKSLTVVWWRLTGLIHIGTWYTASAVLVFLWRAGGKEGTQPFPRKPHSERETLSVRGDTALLSGRTGLMRELELLWEWRSYWGGDLCSAPYSSPRVSAGAQSPGFSCCLATIPHFEPQRTRLMCSQRRLIGEESHQTLWWCHYHDTHGNLGRVPSTGISGVRWAWQLGAGHHFSLESTSLGFPLHSKSRELLTFLAMGHDHLFGWELKTSNTLRLLVDFHSLPGRSHHATLNSLKGSGWKICPLGSNSSLLFPTREYFCISQETSH